MKRFTGLLNRSKSSDATNAPHADSPEATAARGVRLFCESASPDNSGEEVLHLPVIVDAAESSPQAASASAYQIRKFLSKDNYSRPHVQYNAVMLMRILADNPGPTFTRNFDHKFVEAIKELLRRGRDPSVQQIVRETLDSMEAEKAHDEGLVQLLSMWRREKGHGSRIAPSVGPPQNFHVPPYNSNAPPVPPSQQEPSQRVFATSQLPAAHELASRVEEAKNTAKILLQLVQSTPQEEVTANALLHEFAERCQGAQRSMQEYINCDNPPADDDTLLTLIETNEQLSLALSRHQRAVLSARRALGSSSTTPAPAALNEGHATLSAAPHPPPERTYNVTPSSTLSVLPITTTQANTIPPPPGPPPSMTNRYQAYEAPTQPSATDPFADQTEAANPYSAANAYSRPPDVPSYSQQSVDSRQPTRNHITRPGPTNAYHTGPTPSYLGRQASAADGLTMHGGVYEDDDEEEEEEDGNSRNAAYGSGGRYHDGPVSPVSPVEARQPVTYRY